MDLQNVTTYSFQVEIYGDVIYDGIMPIYDADTNMPVGGFTARHGNLIACFLSGQGYPTALNVSSGESFWFTPLNDKKGQVCAAYVSGLPLGPTSKKVTSASANKQGQ